MGQVGTNVDKYGKVSSQGFPWRPIVATLIFNCVRDPLSACLVGQFCRAKPVHFWQAAKGIDEQKTLSRAVGQILANLESAESNSLEIMRVTPEASKRFLGVRYVTVSAQSRHIQESAFLFGAKDLPVRDRARSAAA